MTSHKNKVNEEMLIPHVESSFISVERGLCQEDLELNLSQILHVVLVQSKLIISIYKTLKGPAAFSIVDPHGN